MADTRSPSPTTIQSVSIDRIRDGFDLQAAMAEVLAEIAIELRREGREAGAARIENELRVIRVAAIQDQALLGALEERE